LVINPWNLDQLASIEEETGRKIYSVLQLRLHPELLKLKQSIDQSPADHQHEVNLTYITSRGPWYQVSWKGSVEKSGGIATNIGIHFFDLLLWLFGEAGAVKVHHSDPKRMAGFIEFERARVKWLLSVDREDLPFPVEPGKPSTYRSITIDGQEVEFSSGFTDLHTRIYEETLAGRGFGIMEAYPSIALTHRIRNEPLSQIDDRGHPFLNR
jgi:UDP-N-acetyl-2-amino-2-deoxyglucuronate dehydrogenase